MALVGHISGSAQSNSVIAISGSVIVANRPNSTFPSFPGSDVSFFVSGSKEGRTEGSNVSVFGGQLVISGASYHESGIKATTVSGSGNFDVGGELRVAGDLRLDGNDIKSSTGEIAISLTGQNVILQGDLTVKGTTTTVDSVNLTVKDAMIGLGFSSGSSPAAVIAGDRGWIGGLSGEDNVAMFWDHSKTEFAVVRTNRDPNLEVLPSNLTPTSYTQFHALGLTGSLTKLDDGTDYLRAGSNIQLTTGSSGQVTIAVSGIAMPSTYFDSTTAGSIYTTGSAAFRGEESSVDSPSDKGSDVWFYVSGSTDGTKNALFGGNVITSGSLRVDNNSVFGNSSADTVTFNARANSDLLPSADMTYNLGSSSNRWANVYTGDLHLRNDRGNWTVIEEDEYLSIRNNKTGKLYKFVLEPVEE